MEDVEQIAKEIKALKEEIGELVGSKRQLPEDTNMAMLFKYMTDERERTNKILSSITDKIIRLEKEIDSTYNAGEAYDTGNREIALSALDSKIINFVQTKGMACADEVREHMGYRGRNAACARLNRLYKEGLLDRFQLGHKVYYRFDAGKTTNTLIISPPQ
jgi:hypothetical protein